MRSRRGEMRRFVITVLVVGFVALGLQTNVCHAVLYPFEIFTSNGAYADGSAVNIYMDVYNGDGIAKFAFYNESSASCSITRVFFDDGTLLGIDDIENGPGVLFEQVTTGPGDLPAGENLIPPFAADREFNIGAEPPPYWNGINSPDEWLIVTFELNGSLEDVLNELGNGILRVGIHIQGFSDGSSESAVNVPEPATICLLGLGGLALLRKRKV